LDVDEAENPGSRPTKQPTKSRRWSKLPTTVSIDDRSSDNSMELQIIQLVFFVCLLLSNKDKNTHVSFVLQPLLFTVDAILHIGARRGYIILYSTSGIRIVSH
jgi:hypothetical protein